MSFPVLTFGKALVAAGIIIAADYPLNLCVNGNLVGTNMRTRLAHWVNNNLTGQ